MADDKKVDSIDVIIEITKGSRNKYEYDKKRNIIRYDRMLFSAMHYPSDYGFIPETLALDNDPLDALVLLWEPTFPGCLIESIPIGVLVMADDKGPDEKILCVPVNDPMWNHIKNLADVPPHLLKEIEVFFASYKVLEDKKVTIEGWKNKEEAFKIITEAKKRYQK